MLRTINSFFHCPPFAPLRVLRAICINPGQGTLSDCIELKDFRGLSSCCRRCRCEYCIVTKGTEDGRTCSIACINACTYQGWKDDNQVHVKLYTRWQTLSFIRYYARTFINIIQEQIFCLIHSFLNITPNRGHRPTSASKGSQQCNERGDSNFGAIAFLGFRPWSLYMALNLYTRHSRSTTLNTWRGTWDWAVQNCQLWTWP